MEIYNAPPLEQAGKDYIVQIKIKNGPLLRAMRIRGFKSAAALSKASGIAVSTIGRFLALKFPPIRNGQWTKSALGLAKFLRLPPDSLFPELHLERALAKSSGEFEASPDDIRMLAAPQAELDPEKLLELQDDQKIIEDALAILTPKEQAILRARFGFDDGCETTLERLAQRYVVGRERIRQIEAKALRKLSHPFQARHLLMAYGGNPRQVWLREKLPPTHLGPVRDLDGKIDGDRGILP